MSINAISQGFTILYWTIILIVVSFWVAARMDGTRGLTK